MSIGHKAILFLIAAVVVGIAVGMGVNRRLSDLRPPTSDLAAKPAPEPTHVPFYELPTPAPEPTPSPALPTPEPASPTPSPAFTPDPEVLAFANAVIAQRPWLEAKSSDPNVAPGAAPATTFLTSRAEPVVTREGAGWKITFKP